MKNKLIKLTACITAVAAIATTSISAFAYTDVTADHWSKPYVDLMTGKGWMKGYEDDTFKPDNNITRAEVATVLTTAYGATEASDAEIADLPADAWYTPSMRIAVKAGWFNGSEVDGATYVRPEDAITREEAIVVIVRAAGLTDTDAELNFTDAADISSWATDACKALVKAGKLNGYEDGSVRPQQNVTRAEFAKLLTVALDLPVPTVEPTQAPAETADPNATVDPNATAAPTATPTAKPSTGGGGGGGRPGGSGSYPVSTPAPTATPTVAPASIEKVNVVADVNEGGSIAAIVEGTNLVDEELVYTFEISYVDAATNKPVSVTVESETPVVDIETAVATTADGTIPLKEFLSAAKTANAAVAIKANVVVKDNADVKGEAEVVEKPAEEILAPAPAYEPVLTPVYAFAKAESANVEGVKALSDDEIKGIVDGAAEKILEVKKTGKVADQKKVPGEGNDYILANYVAETIEKYAEDGKEKAVTELVKKLVLGDTLFGNDKAVAAIDATPVAADDQATMNAVLRVAYQRYDETDKYPTVDSFLKSENVSDAYYLAQSGIVLQ